MLLPKCTVTVTGPPASFSGHVDNLVWFSANTSRWTFPSLWWFLHDLWPTGSAEVLIGLPQLFSASPFVFWSTCFKKLTSHAGRQCKSSFSRGRWSNKLRSGQCQPLWFCHTDSKTQWILTEAWMGGLFLQALILWKNMWWISSVLHCCTTCAKIQGHFFLYCTFFEQGQ